MSKKKLLGMEIGNNRIKIVQCTDGEPEKMITAKIPDNLVVDDLIISWDAMSDFIKEVIKENSIGYKEVAMILPEKTVYIKRISMPAMSTDQMKVNLPYEFHDYITEDKDKYFYDYAMIEMNYDETGTPKDMELMGVAVAKDTVGKYKTMIRRAGLKAVLFAPEFSAFKNLISEYEDRQNMVSGCRDYAILDIGHRLLRLTFFTAGEYEVTRNMEPGCDKISEAISERLDVDEHIAEIDKEQNRDGILNDPVCTDIYNQMAVEIMRVLNFYNFNHPENNLETLYYCGAGAEIKPLIEAIAEMIEIKVKSIIELLPGDMEDEKVVTAAPQVLGIVWG